MQMDYVTMIGLAAAAITVVSLFPQLVKIWKTKSTKDISLGMFLLFCGGVFLWFVYGILMQDLPIIVANFLGFIQTLIILIFKVKYK
jgi:MtN3 and saliva related transmembrane protein